MQKILIELLKEKVNRSIDDRKAMIADGQIDAGSFGEGRMCGRIEAFKELLEVLDG